MKEKKFRAWDKMSKKMLFFVGIFNSKPFTERSTFPQYESSPQYHELDVMEATGILDRNDKEIYEGDIVIADYFYTEPHVVELPRDYYDFIEYALEDSMTVIGNIYENPELKENRK